jgi:hypothetical protein
VGSPESALCVLAAKLHRTLIGFLHKTSFLSGSYLWLR